MLRKIILPLVLLMFTQQNSYGMKRIKVDEKDQVGIWESINNCVNIDGTLYPKLWWLWAIVDNVPFQYGNSKMWKHGEAYYGLSNGIGFFPSVLNFGWLKIGFVDAHINVINLFLDYLKNFIQCKTDKKNDILPYLSRPICINLLFNIHIFSVKILNCIKIKLISPLTLLLALDGDQHFVDKGGTAWYITYNESGQIPWSYALLSPRIEINIPGIIKYFRRE